MPRTALDNMVANLQVRGPDDPDGDPGPVRDLTLVEKGRVESTRRVVLLRLGIPPDAPGGAGPPATSGPGPSSGATPPGARRLKLDLFGSDVDPSADQLASLRQVMAAGSAPYADFSLFGPHGLRLLRKADVHLVHTLNVATGEWPVEEGLGGGLEGVPRGPSPARGGRCRI